jgi:type I restriction enzyme, S subunit
MNLSQIMTQIRGLSYSKKDSNNNSFKGAIPVLRAGNIQDSKIIEEDYVYVPNDLVKNKQYLKHGDVLIAASSGSISIVGKAAMIEYDMNATFGAFCKVLRPNSEKINIRYFKHFFETEYYKRTIKSLAEGANINNLKTEHFDDLEIPLPPLDQQKKIAAILDAADAYRQKTKALIEKYDELTQSLFLDMFGDPVSNPKGWQIKSLDNVSLLTTKGSSPKWQGYEYISEGVRFITSENVRLGHLDISKDKFVASEFHGKLLRSQLKENDLLVNLVGASIGRGALVTNDALPANINQAVAKTELDLTKVHPLFILYQVVSPQVQERLIGNKVEGARANISLKNVREMELYIPPISLQNQFAERVQAIEEQKAQAEASLAGAEDLFNSLLQRAFKGELTS